MNWVNAFISWLPFILLIGFWVFFMRKATGLGKQGPYMDRAMEHMTRQEALLERIAKALESLEGKKP